MSLWDDAVAPLAGDQGPSQGYSSLLGQLSSLIGSGPPPASPAQLALMTPDVVRNAMQSTLTARGAGPIEPGTPGYDALQDTFQRLGIARPETPEEMQTAVQNILAGKNRTMSQILDAMPPSGYAMQTEGWSAPRQAPPPGLISNLNYYLGMPSATYHAFQDVFGNRMQQTSEDVARDAYASMPAFRNP
jgi:hypothetical protein